VFSRPELSLVSRWFHRALPAFALPAVVLAGGCGDGTGPDLAVVGCDQASPTVLAPGQVVLADASETACIRLEEAAGPGAEYLYVAYSAAGAETREGTTAAYRLAGAAGTTHPAAVVRPSTPANAPSPTAAQLLHDRLRGLGRELALERPKSRRDRRSGPAVKAPPVPGEQRTFNVLRSASVSGTQADDYVQVVATARYVGSHAAIFLDAAAPTEGGYSQADLDSIGTLFDEHIHPIDVNSFGAETDVNGDGLVLVLLTDRVTRLSGCDQGSFVVGLFFAVDLLEGHVGSNNAEIFYGLTPDAGCGVTREMAVQRLPTVFIHEFQHMINYGQKVIQRGGEAEDVWLDEGLSGLAEELGGRLVPGESCVNGDCLTQFHRNNLTNAYNYLLQQDAAYLIGPPRPPLPLTQYGATWLFVRWLADHFAADSTLGTDLTRALVQTRRTGTDNVESATGTSFDRLIGEWQLANYLEDRPDLEELTAGTRFGYVSWRLRDVFGSFHQQDPVRFPQAYPLQPDILTGGDYVKDGVLRPGSGPHLLVGQPDSAPVDLLLTASDGMTGLPAAAAPRSIVLRLR
jgi:hypothetical protein